MVLTPVGIVAWVVFLRGRVQAVDHRFQLQERYGEEVHEPHRNTHNKSGGRQALESPEAAYPFEGVIVLLIAAHAHDCVSEECVYGAVVIAHHGFVEDAVAFDFFEVEPLCLRPVLIFVDEVLVRLHIIFI